MSSSFKSRLQNLIDSTFEPKQQIKKEEKKESLNQTTNSSFKNIEYYEINHTTLKSMRRSNSKPKIEESTPAPSFFNSKSKEKQMKVTKKFSSAFKDSHQKREKSGNKIKDEAMDYVMSSPRFDFIGMNRPSISAENPKFEMDHFYVNSPNIYKKHYYFSDFCRKYVPNKNSISVYSPKNKNNIGTEAIKKDKIYNKNEYKELKFDLYSSAYSKTHKNMNRINEMRKTLSIK